MCAPTQPGQKELSQSQPASQSVRRKRGDMYQHGHANTLPSSMHGSSLCHSGMATSVHGPMADRSASEPLRPQPPSQGRAAAYQERKQRQACVRCWLTAVHVSLTFCLMCICVIIFLRLKVHQDKLEKLEMNQGPITRSVSRASCWGGVQRLS